MHLKIHRLYRVLWRLDTLWPATACLSQHGGTSCQALTTQHLLARVPSLCKSWGRRGCSPIRGTTCAPFPSSVSWHSLPSPRTGFEWAARRKLGFLAKPAGASLALDRLEKWGVKDRIAKNERGFSSFEHIWLLFNILFVKHLSGGGCFTSKHRSEGFHPLNAYKTWLSRPTSSNGQNKRGKKIRCCNHRIVCFFTALFLHFWGGGLVACCLRFTICLSLTWFPSEMRLKQLHAL